MSQLSLLYTLRFALHNLAKGLQMLLKLLIPVGTVLATPAFANECDPNYTPCVPIASDVDCAGGKGNGPAYVRGPVRVIGQDIYGLDRDNDGVGCE